MSERPTITLFLDIHAAPGKDVVLQSQECRARIDIKAMLRSLEGDEIDLLLRSIGEHMAGSDFLAAFEDWSAVTDKDGDRPLTDLGMKLLDLFVARAEKIDRLPDEFEPPWVDEFRADIDRLHRLVCDGELVEAVDLMRTMAPDQSLRRLADQRNLFPPRTRP